MIMSRINEFVKFVMEGAHYRSHAETQISGRSHTYVDHLLKLILFGQNDDWEDEIWMRLSECQEYKLKKKQIIKPEQVYNLLLLELMEDDYNKPDKQQYLSKIEKILNSPKLINLHSKYRNKQITDIEIENIHKKFKNFTKKISSYISHHLLTKNIILTNLKETGII